MTINQVINGKLYFVIFALDANVIYIFPKKCYHMMIAISVSIIDRHYRINSYMWNPRE